MPERVVITGMGAITPLGLTVPQSWNNVIMGVSGVGPISQFDSSDLLVHIACEVKDFHPEEYMDPKEARRRDRFEQFAAVAARQAIQESGVEFNEQNSGRVGVLISSAIGGLNATFDIYETMSQFGPRRISPFSIPMLMSNGAASLVTLDYGLHGPSFSIASACASGADAIGMASLFLRAGLIDIAIAGASDATISKPGVATFDRLGALSRRTDNINATPQPFDLHRDGLVMGEGAAVLVMERESHARQRGADILAELAGHGSTSDAFHITAPADDGLGGAQAIRLALRNAGVNPDEVGYINAHGTGTELNDLSETYAIKGAFGEQAYKIPVSSTKSMTGHMMGATGALEAIFCVQAVREGHLPPTINYQTPDPRCDLDYIPNQGREKKISVAISNAFGFGGHNAVLVIRAYD
jgi:3-oxoacyl-[acyl-carrier-protein] synthase II